MYRVIRECRPHTALVLASGGYIGAPSQNSIVFSHQHAYGCKNTRFNWYPSSLRYSMSAYSYCSATHTTLFCSN